MNRTFVSEIAFLNSKVNGVEKIKELFNTLLFEKEEVWDNFKLDKSIPNLMDNITSRKKYYMSNFSLGVYNVIEMGPGKNIKNNDEIYLFSGFTEINTVNQIGEMLVNDNYSINPAIFPNSVHHISLCYYTILKGYTNYCAAITDGLFTGLSFINFIKFRCCLDKSFVVVTGEDFSSFFQNNIGIPLNITSSFVSYRMIPCQQRGFLFEGEYSSIEEIINTEVYKKAEYIFGDKQTFFELKHKEKNKKIFTEYPLALDNPCSVAYRIALPFVLELKSNGIIIEKSDFGYFMFSISL